MADVVAKLQIAPPDAHVRDQLQPPPPPPLFDLGELRSWSLYRALVAEFVATILFLYVAIATVVGHKLQAQADQCRGAGVIGVAWAFGGMIFVLVYCTAGISGGHINPAVTFGLLVARKISAPRTVLYVAAQCLGAICQLHTGAGAECGTVQPVVFLASPASEALVKGDSQSGNGVKC